MDDAIQVMTTTEKREDAATIAQTLVAKRLAGCVQVVGPILSTYRWDEGIETAEEWLCLIKSTRQRYGDLEHAIREVHPYDVPEILAVPVELGNPAYLEWLGESVTPGD